MPQRMLSAVPRYIAAIPSTGMRGGVFLGEA